MSTTEQEMFGKGGKLALDLITASMSANQRMIDSLYEREREARQALEVHIDLVLEKFARAYQGTVREYEACVRELGNPPFGEKREAYAAMHEENKGR